jgi:DNA-binding beta-propeller fold protein YncE
MDWTRYAIPGTLGRFLPLSSACANPQGLAVDSKDQRLFVACEDRQFEVLNASTGGIVASLTTGPGDDTIGYDREPGLIFVANGAGYGSLTIIRQDAITDSYSVIQNLPTRERARTLAADSATGEVYLVTDFQGVDLTKPGGIGTLHADPIPGSFQVLVVGH